MSFSFEETKIPGLFIVHPHYHEDERGSNLKTFHKDAFEERGMKCDFSETMVATNKLKDTVRGFHFQYPPYAQYKLYYCLEGAWKNYSLDLRKGSPTYGKFLCVTMSETELMGLYIPEGIANAYIVLKDNTKVLYQLSSKYMPDYEGGVRWDTVGLDLGGIEPIISKRDLEFPAFVNFDTPFIYGENC